MRYVVIENTPGYMPDDVDPFVGTYEDCVVVLNELADEYEADGYRVERGWASAENYAAVMVFDDSKIHDLGRSIEILSTDDEDDEDDEEVTS